jgi:hypothetical protein
MGVLGVAGKKFPRTVKCNIGSFDWALRIIVDWFLLEEENNRRLC